MAKDPPFGRAGGPVGDGSRTRTWRGRAGLRRLLVIVVVAGLLGACGGGDGGAGGGGGGSGGGTTGGGGGGGTGGGGGGGTGGGGEEEEYGWGLPDGPYTPDDTFEDDVYVPLQDGSCAGGQARLEEFWRALKSPRGVLLYQAAVHACRGELDAARQRFEQASAYGWQGLDWVAFGGFMYDCQVYKSVRSVLEQRPRTDLTCQGGDPPAWPTEEREQRDDPRTPEDESTTTQSTVPPTSESTVPPTSESTLPSASS
jgi:hypothetical protein